MLEQYFEYSALINYRMQQEQIDKINMVILSWLTLIEPTDHKLADYLVLLISKLNKNNSNSFIRLIQ